MSTYYLSTGGDDSLGDGTQAKPWRTLAKAQSLLVAGDVLQLQGGSVFPGNPMFTVPVTLTSYGSGRAVIDGGVGTAILFQDCPGVVLNLSLRGSWNAATQTGNVGSGILFQSSQPAGQFIENCIVQDVDVQGFGGRSDAQRGCGVEFFPGGGDSPFGVYRNPIVRRAKVSNCALYGIFLTGWGGSGHNFRYYFDGGTIEDCSVQGVTGQTLPGQGASGAPGPFGGSGITVWTACKLAIRNCTVQGNGAKGNWCVGIGVAYSADCTISRSQSLFQATSVGDGEGMGFDVNSFRCTIEDSYAEGSAGSGMYVCGCGDVTDASNGCTFRRNSIINCGMNGHGNHGLDIGGAVAGTTAEDNTIYLDGSECPAESALRLYGTYPTSYSTNIAQRNVLIGKNGAVLVMHCGPRITNMLTGNTYAGLNAQGQPYFSAKWEKVYAGEEVTYTDMGAWQKDTGQEPG